MQVTCESMIERWSSPDARPLFKGSLIDKEGCCCAQGDVLRCCGWTDAQLRTIVQREADAKVAGELGISRLHAVLLRVVNDRNDGCPQDVLDTKNGGIQRVLGPHANLVLAFGRHIDGLDADGWNRVGAAWDAVWDAVWAAAGAAARAAAWDAAGAAAGAAARAAARDLVGWSKLKEPFFLKMFFDDPAAWVAEVEAGNV